MTMYGNTSIRPGNTITRETWALVRKNDLPERLKHAEGDFGTYAEALERAAHLKSRRIRHPARDDRHAR